MRYMKLVLLLWVGSLLIACGEKQQTGGEQVEVDKSKIYRWKMVTTWPANFPVLQEAPERLADKVRSLSGGRLDIRVYASGELVPALEVFDAVSQGVAEMGHGTPYYWAGKVPAAQFFSSVPFGMTSAGAQAWINHGGGLELWRELYEPFNLMPFPIGTTGIQMGGWFNKRIDSVADIKGLRMRIPGLGGKVLKRAGGNPILISGGELYTALERGTIDATEWVGPSHDLRMGLYRAADYYYYPGWHEPSTTLELIVNKDKWNSLPADLQAIVEEVTVSVGSWSMTIMEHYNSVALEELRGKKTLQVLPFPDDVLETLKEMTDEALDEEAEKDANFKRVYESYTAFREKYQKWRDISERAMINTEDVAD
ncbi:MAG: TRAP transporter substrate-binding protein [Gammaproteobacteria bacterium]